MAAMQSFTLVGSGGMLPQEILIIGVLRHILVHSEAYRGSLSSSLAELLELETISIGWDIGLLSMPITSACIHS